MDQDDETHFRSFVTARHSGLRRLAYLTCGNWAAADDAVADALSRLYLRWRSVDNPEAYTRTMVIRAAVDETRRPWSRRERPSSDAFPDVPGVDHSAATDERLRMAAALWQVPAKQRAALVLRFYAGLSVHDTATELECSEGSVKSRVSRGLQALRRALEAQGYELRGDEREQEDELSGAGRHGTGGVRRTGTATHR